MKQLSSLFGLKFIEVNQWKIRLNISNYIASEKLQKIAKIYLKRISSFKSVLTSLLFRTTCLDNLKGTLGTILPLSIASSRLPLLCQGKILPFLKCANVLPGERCVLELELRTIDKLHLVYEELQISKRELLDIKVKVPHTAAFCFLVFLMIKSPPEDLGL